MPNKQLNNSSPVVRRVCSGKMNGSYHWTTGRSGIAVPSLFLQGSMFTDAGFRADDLVTVLVCDGMLIVVPSSRVGEQARSDADDVNRRWSVHQGRVA